MTKRRVVLDARLIRHTGIGTYIRTLFSSLPELGAPYEYVTLSNPSNPVVGPWPSLTVRSNPLGISNQLLPWELRHEPVALLHAPHVTLPLAWSGPTVVTIHDLIPLIYPEVIPSLSRRLAFSASVRAAARRAAVVLTVSEHSRKDIIRLLGVGSDRIHIIPPAVAPEFMRPADPRAIEDLKARLGADTYLLSFGRDKPHKNIVRLLRAFSKLVLPRTVLVIVGLSPPPAGLLEVARRLGVTDALRFVGYVPQDDLPTYYYGARALVFPSLYEGFGLPVLEAMACGTPVVASNRSAVPELIDEAGLLVDPENEADLTNAMGRIVDDAALRDRLRARGRERIAAFQPDVLAARLAGVYRLALEQPYAVRSRGSKMDIR